MALLHVFTYAVLPFGSSSSVVTTLRVVLCVPFLAQMVLSTVQGFGKEALLLLIQYAIQTLKVTKCVHSTFINALCLHTAFSKTRSVHTALNLYQP